MVEELEGEGEGAEQVIKYHGLPEILAEYLQNYSNEELLFNPIGIVRSIIRMHALLKGGMGGLISVIDDDADELPEVELTTSSSENAEDLFQSMRRNLRDTALFTDAEIKTDDPSQTFDIKHEDQLGEGGFAKVFKVKRREDGLVCALKFCEPKTNSDRNLIINEIGLMNQCQDQDTVLKIYRSYDYRDRIWIFLELMSCDLTSVIDNYHERYSENVVKYILWKILVGLHNLH